jgi:hypothetical protein
MPSARAARTIHEEPTMSERDRERNEGSSGSPDREIPRGTDEHSDESRGAERGGAGEHRHHEPNDSGGDASRGQHARKGQAQSPVEDTLNQPEKKREGRR